jgi:hypothetical protein
MIRTNATQQSNRVGERDSDIMWERGEEDGDDKN